MCTWTLLNPLDRSAESTDVADLREALSESQSGESIIDVPMDLNPNTYDPTYLFTIRDKATGAAYQQSVSETMSIFAKSNGRLAAEIEDMSNAMRLLHQNIETQKRRAKEFKTRAMEVENLRAKMLALRDKLEARLPVLPAAAAAAPTTVPTTTAHTASANNAAVEGSDDAHVTRVAIADIDSILGPLVPASAASTAAAATGGTRHHLVAAVTTTTPPTTITTTGGGTGEMTRSRSGDAIVPPPGKRRFVEQQSHQQQQHYQQVPFPHSAQQQRLPQRVKFIYELASLSPKPETLFYR